MNQISKVLEYNFEPFLTFEEALFAVVLGSVVIGVQWYLWRISD